ncbi:MAG: alpha-N-arabinofuranosidase [Planctomycetes bacterium]|nr:alpha-N-arabinofuranosidase [Planctomycetota bacterium]
MAKLTIRLEDRLGTISPMLYGHFAEHLGRCIYEGFWVGEGSPIPNTRGIRNDTAAALRRLRAPVLRWPGGCFADDYHWRDGLGPRDARPRRVNLWWHAEEANHFGTHEFIDLCRQAGAAPYICLNVGSGTPEEAAAWVEYCNWAGNTARSAERAANGSPEPFAVKYWGVGNENWGCGGRFYPDDYAREYRRFACYLRGRSSSPIELIACGHNTPDWNRRFLETPGDMRMLDHLSVHRYYNCGHATEFTDTECYNLYPRALQVEQDITEAATAIALYNRTGRKIGVIVDEWGVWHPEAGNATGLYQRNTLRDALVAAAVFDAFNRHADALTMANIAQTINVLQCVAQTQEEKMWLTPTYHAFDLYKEHMGNASVRVEMADVPTVEARKGDGAAVQLPVLSASASVSPEGKTLILTLQNSHLTEPCDVAIRLRDGAALKAAAKVLTAKDVRDHNGPEAPHKVRPRRFELGAKGSTLRATIPPHALVCARVALR